MEAQLPSKDIGINVSTSNVQREWKRILSLTILIQWYHPFAEAEEQLEDRWPTIITSRIEWALHQRWLWTFSACLRSVIVHYKELAAKNYRLNCETQARINHIANQSRASSNSNLHTSDIHPKTLLPQAPIYLSHRWRMAPWGTRASEALWCMMWDI